MRPKTIRVRMIPPSQRLEQVFMLDIPSDESGSHPDAIQHSGIVYVLERESDSRFPEYWAIRDMYTHS